MTHTIQAPFPLVREVVPARAQSARDVGTLETTMHTLALDARTPVALEIAATATTRAFLLRARTPLALQHLTRQMQARYPQTQIREVVTEPLVLKLGEACSVIELRPGAANYLPLRSWKPREWLEEGADPLLGILAACADLPPQTRVVAQIALLPASPTWSAGLRRLAVEHPLEQERAQRRAGATTSASVPSLGKIALMMGAVLVLALLYVLQGTLSHLIPPAVSQAVKAVLQGQPAHLSAGATAQLIVFGLVLALVILAGMVGVARVMARFGQAPFYDMRLVDAKTARPAYRARLRLYLMAQGFLVLPTPTTSRARLASWWKHTSRRWRRCWQAGKMVPASPAGHSGQAGWLTRGRARIALTWRRGHRRARVLVHQGRAGMRLWRARTARQRQREERVQFLVAAYQQYHLASGGFFRPARLSSRRVCRLFSAPQTGLAALLSRTGWDADLPHSGHLLSVADLAALWHLPQTHDLADLVYVEQEPARTLLAPTVLAAGPGYPLGISTHAGQTVPVLLPFACLWQNLLIAASTGKGKSNLLEHLVRATAAARLAGHPVGDGGALFVDPHGDQVEHLIGTLPASLADDVALIRLADRDYPVGLNPLDMSQGQDRDKIIDNLIQVIEALWPWNSGPRTENFLEYGCKTLAEANLSIVTTDPVQGPDRQFTLLDVVHLFRQDTFRGAVFELVRDTHLLSWWNDYYEQLDGKQQAEYSSSLVTKLSKFASSRISRRILGQPRSSLTFGELIGQKKLVLLSCAAGDVGADLAALFGSLLLGFFQQALAEQARLTPESRQRFLVVIDEFQTLKADYQTMLAEMRKYGGTFALATQSLAYLDRFEKTLRATVLANVEHVFAFAMASEDARLLHLPGVEPEDIIQLPDYTCYARLSLAGRRLPVFSLRLHAPEQVSPSLQQEITLRSRARYGKPVGVVDEIVRDADVRRHTMRPMGPRHGGKGAVVDWSGTGAQRVDSVLAPRTPHHGGRAGSGNKANNTHPEEITTPAEHLVYVPNGAKPVIHEEERTHAETDTQEARERESDANA